MDPIFEKAAGTGLGYENHLHIYAQVFWHDTAWVVGTAEALAGLRDAIGRALASPNKNAVCPATVSDGEGYDVRVLVTPAEAFDEFTYPYTDEMANGGNDERAWPPDVFRKRASFRTAAAQ